MKPLACIFILCALMFFGAGCSEDLNLDEGKGQETILDQEVIKQKIIDYYSSPSSEAQPVPIIEAVFNEKFPNATNVEWSVSNNVYEINFELNGVGYEAWYGSDAQLLMYKYDINNSNLASAVSTAMINDYPGYSLQQAEKVHKGNIEGYYLEVEKNKSDKNAFYKNDGTFLAKTLWEDDNMKPGYDDEDISYAPKFNGSYTDDEVDAFVSAYYSGYEVDVRATDVPAAIRTQFKKDFPRAKNADWEVSANVYKVDFTQYSISADAWYTPAGILLVYKYDISKTSLPKAVRTAISSRFSGYKIDESEKVIKINSTTYFVEVEKQDMEVKAYYAKDGTYISNSFYKSSSDEGGGDPGEPEEPGEPEGKDYTDAEIDALLLAYHQGRSRDIHSSNVPSAVTTAFKKEFKTAKDVEWEYLDNVYNVEFEVSKVDYEAWYVNNGFRLMYMKEILNSSVKAVVKNAIKKQYPDYKVEDSYYFKKGTIIGYIVELEHNRTDAEITVVYKNDGTFLYQYNN